MHPLVRTDYGRQKLFTATEFAVTVDGDETYEQIRSDWYDHHNQKYTWDLSSISNIQQYGTLESTTDPFLVKCDFLKIHNCVLMLFQPGKYVNHRALAKQVHSWLGTEDSSAITNLADFLSNRIWTEITKEQSPKLSSEFPYGATAAVRIENDEHKKRFINAIRALCKQKKTAWSLVSQGDIKKYVNDAEEKMPMYAKKHANLINDFVVTFFYNSDTFGNQQALLEEAREWFPNATLMLNSQAKDLFSALTKALNSGKYPSAYQKLIAELKKEAPPTIDLSGLKEGEVPNEAVSSHTLIEEMGLETYYQKTNPEYQCPQKILCDYYLEPRLSTMRDTIFPAIKEKINASVKQWFKAEFTPFSLWAFPINRSDDITVTLRQDGADDSISLVGPDRITTNHMRILEYSGNLQRLVNIIDSVTQNWNIEKFQECDSAFMC